MRSLRCEWRRRTAELRVETFFVGSWLVNEFVNFS